MKDSTGDDIERELIDAYNSRVSPSRQAQRVDAEARIDTLPVSYTHLTLPTKA